MSDKPVPAIVAPGSRQLVWTGVIATLAVIAWTITVVDALNRNWNLPPAQTNLSLGAAASATTLALFLYLDHRRQEQLRKLADVFDTTTESLRQTVATLNETVAGLSQAVRVANGTQNKRQRDILEILDTIAGPADGDRPAAEVNRRDSVAVVRDLKERIAAGPNANGATHRIPRPSRGDGN